MRAALARLGARIALNRRGVVLGALGAALFARRSSRAGCRDKLAGALPPGDHVLGKPDAPNIIIDYFSLTCPHCANFNAAVLPVVRREWIDTGRARFIYRHFPSDSVATHAAQLAEGAGPEKFFPTVETPVPHPGRLADARPIPRPKWSRRWRGQACRRRKPRPCFADDRLLDKVIADVQSGQALGGQAARPPCSSTSRTTAVRPAPTASARFYAKWGGNRLTPHRLNSQDVVERKT